MLAKRAKMGLLCNGYHCLLEFDLYSMVGFGCSRMSLPSLSYDFQSDLGPWPAAEIEL